jgi:hypothetical protein
MIPADAWTVADPTVCEICGRDSCEDHLPPEGEPTATTTRRLIAHRAVDVIAEAPPTEILEGIAWARNVSVVASESGVGKTFVLLDAGAAVADGVAWHGREVQPGSVVYVSFEGDALGLRLKALRDHVGRRLEHLYIVRAHDPISPRVTRDGEERSLGEITLAAALTTLTEELAAAERPPIVLGVIDTVRASLTGSEDSSESVSAYLRAVRRLLVHLPHAAVILAHHSGWQDGGDTQRKRERGSSAWRGNCDGTLYLEAGTYDPDRREAPLSLRALKVRDGERPPPLHLIRRRVELLEMDRYGEPVTSCVIERDRRTREDRDAERAQVVNLANRATDGAVLQAMQAYPDATSISRLRPYVGLRTEDVSAAVARILRAGWATEGKRGQPYTVTAAGEARIRREEQP